MPPATSTTDPFDAEVRVQHTLYETADGSFAVVLVQAQTATPSRLRDRSPTLRPGRGHEAELRGHTFLSREDLRVRAAGLVGALEDSVLEGLAADGQLALAEHDVSLASTYETERGAAAKLARLAESRCFATRGVPAPAVGSQRGAAGGRRGRLRPVRSPW